MTAEQRRVRARLAANKRHHPDDPELTAADAAALERVSLDRHIDELVARAPKMTTEQADRIRRLFRYGPADAKAPVSETGAPTERTATKPALTTP